MIIDRLRIDDVQVRTSDDDRETAIILLTATVLLVTFFYWGKPGFYFRSGLVNWVADRAGGVLGEYNGLGAYLWWGLTSVGFRVVAPLLVIVFVLRARPAEFGFRLKGILRHMPIYLGIYLVMLPVLIWASSLDTFLNFYPFYDRAGDRSLVFWLYELGYGLQFVGIEAFFRGFLTFGLARRFGLLGVVIMTVPYTMIHFSKPMPEAFGAIIAGLVLGYLALRSKSFVPGVMLHFSVAITMDLLVISRTGGLGSIF